MKAPYQKSLGLLATGILLTLSSPGAAQTIFVENFNGFTAPAGNFNGGQFQSGSAVAFSGSLPGWGNSGDGTVHAVDHANVFANGINNPRDFAVMFWHNNVITQSSAAAGSNIVGAAYEVSFSASPAVYQAPSQQTTTDGLLIDVLRGDNSVLATHTYLPGAWAGTINLAAAGFSYTGDGTGDVRLRVGPSAFNSGRFGGAIDNLSLSQVPEPSAFLLALGGIGLIARRKRA